MNCIYFCLLLFLRALVARIARSSIQHACSNISFAGDIRVGSKILYIKKLCFDLVHQRDMR